MCRTFRRPRSVYLVKREKSLSPKTQMYGNRRVRKPLKTVVSLQLNAHQCFPTISHILFSIILWPTAGPPVFHQGAHPLLRTALLPFSTLPRPYYAQPLTGQLIVATFLLPQPCNWQNISPHLYRLTNRRLGLPVILGFAQQYGDPHTRSLASRTTCYQTTHGLFQDQIQSRSKQKQNEDDVGTFSVTR